MIDAGKNDRNEVAISAASPRAEALDGEAVRTSWRAMRAQRAARVPAALLASSDRYQSKDGRSGGITPA